MGWWPVSRKRTGSGPWRQWQDWQDWQEVILPLVALGCAVWLVGDMRNQLHAIGSRWHGEDMTADWSEHPMVISAVGHRLTLTEGHRCDARLFAFLSELAYGPGDPHGAVPRGLPR